MSRGVPPTAFHARTGLLTPPGIFSFARSKSLVDLIFDMSGVHVTFTIQRVKLTERQKKLFCIFFLQRNLKLIMTISPNHCRLYSQFASMQWEKYFLLFSAERLSRFKRCGVRFLLAALERLLNLHSANSRWLSLTYPQLWISLFVTFFVLFLLNSRC